MRLHLRIWYGFSGTVTLAMVVLLLATAYGGHVDPHSHAWPAILSLAYPIVLAMAVVLLIVWLLLRHRWHAAALAVGLLCTWPTLRVTAPLHLTGGTIPDTCALRVLSYNVHNFGYTDSDSSGVATLRYIIEQGADIVLLQEGATDYDPERDLPQLQPLLPQLQAIYPYRSHGYHDVTILSRYPYTVVEDTLMRQTFDNNPAHYHVYAKAFDIDIAGRQLRVVSSHLQSIGLSDGDKRTYENLTRLDSVGSREQMSQVRHSLYGKLASAYRRRASEAHVMRQFIDSCPPNLIVCGDFNDTPASFSYLTVRGDDLCDAYADAAFGPTFTYNRNRFYFRIDHILYRGDLEAVSARSDHKGDSDHYPITATFKWTR